MILNRLGNKDKLAHKIIPYFPKHDIYMEPFFGTGSIFFHKPKAKYNFLNDLDNDVYNLFRQVKDNKSELIKEIKLVPITEKQFKEWGKGKREKTDVLNAVRFLILSDYGYYGRSNTLRIGPVNPRKIILENIDKVFDYLKDAYFFNIDFREFFTRLDYKKNKERCFTYVDPPYLENANMNDYISGFTKQDSIDLFETLEKGGTKWAMSEFENPFTIEQAEKRNLQIHRIGERTNLKNKRNEILITNYKNKTKLFNLYES